MKKFPSMFLVGTIVCSLAASNVNAQLLSAKSPAEAITNSATATTAAENKKAVTMFRANERALTNFRKRFKDVPAEKWHVGAETISASYVKDDVKTSVVYDHKGRWVRTENIYQSDNIPVAIIDQIMRSQYRRYKINMVQEFFEGPNKFHVIHLEDKDSFKLVVLSENELGLYKTVRKIQQ
jgi:hypothetical protein